MPDFPDQYRQEHLQMLGLLTAGIAHELNTPLSVVRSNSNVLSELLVELTDAPDETSRQALLQECQLANRDVVSSIEQLIDIVSAISVFNKDQAQVSVFPINQPIDHALRLVWSRIKYDVVLSREVASDCMVSGQLGQLVQVFVNLIVNATQAMDALPNKQLEIIAERRQQSVVVSISDSGPGIIAEQTTQVFQPFFTTKKDGSGTGLGLAIVQDILAKHQASIRIAPSRLSGATFEMTFPLAEASQ